MVAMLVTPVCACTAEYGLKDKNFPVAWNEIEFLDVQRCATPSQLGCQHCVRLPLVVQGCPHPNHVLSIISLMTPSHVVRQQQHDSVAGVLVKRLLHMPDRFRQPDIMHFAEAADATHRIYTHRRGFVLRRQLASLAMLLLF